MDVAPDDEQLAQWMALCDDCDNPVEYYCNTCGDKLCGSCKQQHLSRRKNRNHEVVPYTSGVHISTPSTATCDKHTDRQIDLFCKPCQIPVCSQCVAETHCDHKLTSLVDTVSLAREQATAILQRMLTEDRPRLRQEKTSATAIMERVEEGLNDTEQKMRKTAEVLHKEIDAFLETDLLRLREIRTREVLPKVRGQKEKASERLDLLEDEIKSYEDNLRSDNPVTLWNFMKIKTQSSENLFSPVDCLEVPLPEFKPGAINTSVLRDQFGFLDQQHVTIQRKPENVQRSKSVNKSGDFTVKEELKPAEAERQKPHKMLVLGKPILRSVFTVNSKEISGLCRLRLNNESKIWMHGEGRRILLTDLKGLTLKSVDAGCKIYWYTGMAVTKANELLYCDFNGDKVMKRTESKVTTFLTTKPLWPYDIYCYPNGNIIVTFSSGCVKIYTQGGKFITDIGNDHLKAPNYMTVNKLNQEICVSDDMKPVVVFSSDGHHRFTYRGVREDDGKSDFTPRDLCADQMGNILITDFDFHRVHIVDKDGMFLRYLATASDGLQNPCTIDINNNGDVMIGEKYSKKVKIYRYLSSTY